MDAELSMMLSITHRLPQIRGATRLATVFKNFYLRKKRSPVICNVLGLKMHVDPHECVDSWVLFYPQLYDCVEIGYLKKNLPQDGIFLDIGANIGFYSLIASRLAPRGKVIAFEADPFNQQKLLANLSLNGTSNCIALNVGVSDRHETLSLGLNTSGNRGGNSFLQTDKTHSVEVECKPLYALLIEQKVSKITGAKFDIEGFEYRVIKQFFNDAPTSMHPQFIILEQYDEWVERSGGDAIELLKAYGYFSVKIHEANYIMEKLPQHN